MLTSHKHTLYVSNQNVAFETCFSFVLYSTNGAITFAHIFQKFRLRTVFICAQIYISFAHNFSVTFARMFLRIFLVHVLKVYDQ